MDSIDIITWVVKGLLGFLVILSGIYKFTGSEKVMTTLEKAGVAQFKNYLGLGEIVFAVLFLIPVTSQIGFLLLICYFSGALAVDLSHKNLFIAPLVILVLIFVAGYLNSPSLFFTR